MRRIVPRHIKVIAVVPLVAVLVLARMPAKYAVALTSTEQRESSTVRSGCTHCFTFGKLGGAIVYLTSRER